eukprot:NODE_15712_length_224_cov_43.562130.p3 GENE.NODE_15712_length_224_cov_43.562130~~NODE_15712_length_224_cov_43.562130.p3  ORF type:complete len:64 (+),score=55.68 NODE_15712_length_224_cov_43.562130:25-192(+)
MPPYPTFLFFFFFFFFFFTGNCHILAVRRSDIQKWWTPRAPTPPPAGARSITRRT